MKRVKEVILVAVDEDAVPIVCDLHVTYEDGSKEVIDGSKEENSVIMSRLLRMSFMTQNRRS